MTQTLDIKWYESAGVNTAAVFAEMRIIQSWVDTAWGIAKALSPRSGELAAVSADFDHVLRRMRRVLRQLVSAQTTPTQFASEMP